MTISELGSMGEFLGSILTIATLIYLATQVRQATAQQRREELITVYHGQNSVVAQLQDPKVVRAFAVTSDGDGSATVGDRSMAIVWVIQYLNHFQIVHELYEGGSMNEEQYQLWAGFAVAMVAPKGIRAWWDGEDGKRGFHSGVRDFIDGRLADETNPPVPMGEMWEIFSGSAWK